MRSGFEPVRGGGDGPGVCGGEAEGDEGGGGVDGGGDGGGGGVGVVTGVLTESRGKLYCDVWGRDTLG